jgi:hypothetical protein
MFNAYVEARNIPEHRCYGFYESYRPMLTARAPDGKRDMLLVFSLKTDPYGKQGARVGLEKLAGTGA